MFQGMFRRRGRPPEQLPIGGYDKLNKEEIGQIPVHQSLEAPRQLPLPFVREFEQDVVTEPEINAGNNLSVRPFSAQHVDNMSNSQDTRLALNSTDYEPFSQAQRNEIFSETSSRIYRELCGPEGVVLRQNNILQQMIQEVHSDPLIQETLSENNKKHRPDCDRDLPVERGVGKIKTHTETGFCPYWRDLC